MPVPLCWPPQILDSGPTTPFGPQRTYASPVAGGGQTLIEHPEKTQMKSILNFWFLGRFVRRKREEKNENQAFSVVCVVVCNLIYFQHYLFAFQTNVPLVTWNLLSTMMIP